MRTNIVLDDQLVREAMRVSGLKTKRAVVEAGLRLLVQTKAQAGMRFRVIDEQDHIREHIKIFVNQELASDLSFRLRSDDTVRISMALSGGHAPLALIDLYT